MSEVRTLAIFVVLLLGACSPGLDAETQRKIHERYERDESRAIEYAQKCRLTNTLEECQAACDRAYSNLTSAVGLPVACKGAAMVASPPPQ